MNNIEKRAEDSARQYAVLNQPMTELQKEDYMAGYLAAAVNLEIKLEFARKQLRQLLVIAAEQKDVYSVSIIRYALETLK